MTTQGILLDEVMLNYDFGRDHVMNTKRILPAYYLFQELFLPNEDTVFSKITPNKNLDRDLLFKAHDEDYIKIVEELSKNGNGNALDFGLGTPDNPVWKGMAEVSEFVVNSAVTSAETVYNETYNYAFVLLGGLHHATRRKASGFCYYNDINVAIHKLKSLQEDIRILYLDTDLHHGDGVQFDFYNDPNVLTISLHESGQFLFPGTGGPEEIGEGEGKGSSVNIPFYPYTWDDAYVKTFDKVLPTLFESYKPDYVIWQAGSDAHIRDPLGHMMLTSSTYHHIGKTVKQLAEKNMEIPKVLTLGGGGYNPYGNAKSWGNAIAGLTGFRLPRQGPKTWVDICLEKGITIGMELHENKSTPIKSDEQSIAEGNQNYYDALVKELSPYFSL